MCSSFAQVNDSNAHMLGNRKDVRCEVMPLVVKNIRTAISGELMQGSDQLEIHHGAYRLKQVRNKNTILFARTKVVNWASYKAFFPIILVTEKPLSRHEKVAGITFIKVTNIEDAFWKFVHYYRSLFQIPIIAVTGTSGKTTTKEMINHILSEDKVVTATRSTTNSRTMNLQYLLSIEENTEVAVIETAVGAPSDLITAGHYFKPTIGVITNIGAHHLNYCKTPAVYREAKGEMMDALNQSGTLIINAEDENTKKLDFTKYKGEIIKVGIHPTCQYRATNMTYTKTGMRFLMVYENKAYPMFVPGFGAHQVYNALAAVVSAHLVGVDFPTITNRLKTYKNYNKMLQQFVGINGCTLLDDTWSITTTSLEAALHVLNELGKGKEKIAVIGTMTDLGPWGYVIHEQAGDLVHKIGVDTLITIGLHAKIIADQAVKSGLKAKVYAFNNNILAYRLLEELVDENTIVLIKGDMYSKPVIELALKMRGSSK